MSDDYSLEEDEDSEIPTLWIEGDKTFYAAIEYSSDDSEPTVDEEGEPNPDVRLVVAVNNMADGILDPTPVMQILAEAAQLIHEEFWPVPVGD